MDGSEGAALAHAAKQSPNGSSEWDSARSVARAATDAATPPEVTRCVATTQVVAYSGRTAPTIRTAGRQLARVRRCSDSVAPRARVEISATDSTMLGPDFLVRDYKLNALGRDDINAMGPWGSRSVT